MLLPFDCLDDAAPHNFSAFLLMHPLQFVRADPVDTHAKVDPVQKGAGYPSLIVLHLKRRTLTPVHIRIIATGTGIGRCHEEHFGRISVSALHSSDRNLMGLQRLPQ